MTKKLQHLTSYDDFVENVYPLNEGIRRIKRKYGENPNVHIYQAAKIRNKIVEFVGDKVITDESMQNFINQMKEDASISGFDYKKWFSRNEKYFDVQMVKSQKVWSLSKYGKRVLNNIQERNIDEGLNISDIEKLFNGKYKFKKRGNSIILVNTSLDADERSDDGTQEKLEIVKILQDAGYEVKMSGYHRHQIEIVENVNEAKKKIKKYADVQIGDIAYENPEAGGEWDNEEGEIVWKGTYKELKASRYKNTAKDWDDLSDIDDYDLVVVDIPSYGPTLFNYDNDPSGCVVFESINIQEKLSDKDYRSALVSFLEHPWQEDTEIQFVTLAAEYKKDMMANPVSYTKMYLNSLKKQITPHSFQKLSDKFIDDLEVLTESIDEEPLNNESVKDRNLDESKTELQKQFNEIDNILSKLSIIELAQENIPVELHKWIEINPAAVKNRIEAWVSRNHLTPGDTEKIKKGILSKLSESLNEKRIRAPKNGFNKNDLLTYLNQNPELRISGDDLGGIVTVKSIDDLADDKFFAYDKKDNKKEYDYFGIDWIIVEGLNLSDELLKKQGYELGDTITKKDQLKVGDIYCIVDWGMSNWQGGYKYEGKKNGKHHFVSILQGEESEINYTESELKDAIDDGEFAFCVD